MITFLCEHESAEVKIASVRGYVGVFSYDLYGGIVTRHIWPEGRVSQCSGPETPGEAEAGFRNHVAQITWDGTLAASDILSEAQQGEFRWWCESQLRYKYAHETLGMKDGNAYANRFQRDICRAIDALSHSGISGSVGTPGCEK